MVDIHKLDWTYRVDMFNTQLDTPETPELLFHDTSSCLQASACDLTILYTWTHC